MAFHQTPKSALPLNALPPIDAALKQLKVHSRAIHTVLASFDDELLLLHRLFYRAKNQHRGALFWRRVAEMRRYAERVESLSLVNIFETLRGAFFDQSQPQTPKLLKGSWTHHPDKTFLADNLRRVQESITLLQKASSVLFYHVQLTFECDRCLSAWRAHTTSRMNKLNLEITETLVQAVATIQSISTALDLPHVEAPPEREPLGSDTPRAVPEPTTRLGRAEMHDDAPRNEHGTPANRLSPRSMAVSVQQRVVKRVKPDKRPQKKHKAPRDEIDDIFG
ncbi:hypothetical protein HMN09_00073500 [Mycena chlorophos]|uniref:Nucleolus and neural progenitor protein-like N-terminal domain-containing protein n=1 Tax=Mycena chlorophos TaxID=658473 RepID=A0A8H6TPP3_MYCCL|nr:hypothetical protein HMN09_00073500 [Mycena chlorophos]